MRLVILESPYAGNRKTNMDYAYRAMVHSLSLGEAPFASHLLYPQLLDDDNSEQRALGMAAGLEWLAKADATVVYTDLGVSPGMSIGINRAISLGKPVEYRSIGYIPEVANAGL